MNTIPLSKRLSYAATDTAGQLVFAVISNYLLYFYTDVYGISVGIAGTILPSPVASTVWMRPSGG